MPVAPAVAIVVAELLHTPDGVASARVVVAPVHTVLVPVIAATTGSALTVTALVAVATPQELTTL
jgi:hypothetical protein